MMWRLAIWACALPLGGLWADSVSQTVDRCLSCHLGDDGLIDIVGLRALSGLPEEWPLLFEDAFDLDGNGAAGQVQYVSGGGRPLVARWGRNLAAARFADFALIAARAHGISIDSPQTLAAVEAAFVAKSPEPEPAFGTAAHKAAFEADGCARCHVTKTYDFEGKTYQPLSDFLLHDLGDGPVRTAPLWGCRGCLDRDPHSLADD